MTILPAALYDDDPGAIVDPCLWFMDHLRHRRLHPHCDYLGNGGVSPCDTTTGASDRSSGRGCAACRRACAACTCTMSARIPLRPRRPAHQCTCPRRALHDRPVVGVGEMARVTRPGGVVAACVCDYGGGRGPLSTFWRAAKDLDPDALDESGLAGARAGHLTELVYMAGLSGLESTELTVRVAYVGFDAWWEP